MTLLNRFDHNDRAEPQHLQIHNMSHENRIPQSGWLHLIDID